MVGGSEGQPTGLEQIFKRLNSLAGTPTLADRAIQAKVDLLEPQPKLGHFSDRSAENPDSKPETELAIVAEAKAAVQKGKETGRYLTKEENPFGENVNKVLLYVFGDRHITGSNPKESVESRSTLINIAQKLGSTTIKHLLKGENWLNNEKPRRTVDAARAIFETIRANFHEHRSIIEDPEAAVAIVNIGDEGGTELTLGDYAYIVNEDDHEVVNLEKIVQSIAGKAELTLPYVRVLGNHDSDVNNKGLEATSLLKDFFTPPFIQEVGSSHLILSLDTNLGSSFWLRSIIKELEKHPEQIAIAQMAVEMAKKQEKLIKKAMQQASEGSRKIILIGHDEQILEKFFPLNESTVTHIISGHYHSPKNEVTEQRNETGDNITRVRVGAPFLGMPGWDKEQPSVNYAIEIDPTQENPVQIKALEIPKWAGELI